MADRVLYVWATGPRCVSAAPRVRYSGRCDGDVGGRSSQCCGPRRRLFGGEGPEAGGQRAVHEPLGTPGTPGPPEMLEAVKAVGDNPFVAGGGIMTAGGVHKVRGQRAPA